MMPMPELVSLESNIGHCGRAIGNVSAAAPNPGTSNPHTELPDRSRRK